VSARQILDNVRIVTHRLVLREIEESDLVALHNYWSDSEVARYMPRGPLTEDGVKSLVQTAITGRRSQPRRYFRLAMVLKEGERIIGDCVCRVSDPENREDFSRIIGQAYIGFFFSREVWGHGYATEVAGSLAFGFEHLGLAKIWAWCDTENEASVRVLEKVGVRREAHVRKSLMVQGEWRDCFVYCLLSDECVPEIRSRSQNVQKVFQNMYRTSTSQPTAYTWVSASSN